jgi:TetR/AcrR family transcriptional regulator
MFEGLIEFIETTLFTLVNRSRARRPTVPRRRSRSSQGVSWTPRRIRDDARVDRRRSSRDDVQARMNQLYERIEAALRQALRIARPQAPGRTIRAAGNAARVCARPVAALRGRLQALAAGGWDEQRKFLFRVARSHRQAA